MPPSIRERSAVRSISIWFMIGLIPLCPRSATAYFPEPDEKLVNNTKPSITPALSATPVTHTGVPARNEALMPFINTPYPTPMSRTTSPETPDPALPFPTRETSPESRRDPMDQLVGPGRQTADRPGPFAQQKEDRRPESGRPPAENLTHH